MREDRDDAIAGRAPTLAGVNAALLRALVACAATAALLVWSARAFLRARTVWRLLQLLGAACLMVVVLAHVAEALALFPSMGWGAPDSAGHYLDLASAVLGLALLPVGYLGARRPR